ncbi:competence type IV pilus assembly protein ComGB [Fervidibacillus albus]|uniref:Competence type IV pilus assembly protein ComGB n=1 Tax=Fervidibacillus albus TaxID=2980026 RepID=A0A9E8LW51_9BACI|nr:competence type IV pilus assembly protein ComGB [Fervidibacillus albus]WAA10430.1 competence type IV pilus assembly protein ComGB [Fervidibacillus albus]
MGRIKWNIKDQAIFLNRLSTLLDEGYTMSEAIRFLSIQSEKPKGETLSKLETVLKNGNPFYVVLQKMEYDPVAVSFCFYGEQNGRLSDSLKTAGEILQKRYDDRQRLQKLAAYPLFLLLFIGVLFVFFQWLLLPQFHILYESFQVEPNMILSILFWLNDHPFLLLLITTCTFTVVFFLLNWVKRHIGDYRFQCIIVEIPIVGSLFRLMNTYYISYQFSQFLKNGLSLSESLTFIQRDPERRFFSEAAERIERDLISGMSFDRAVANIPLWQRELSLVIHHGQLIGKLDTELSSFSRYCLERFSEKVDRMVRLIQPVIFSLIGIGIIFFYFSIMVPSFQLINEL